MTDDERDRLMGAQIAHAEILRALILEVIFTSTDRAKNLGDLARITKVVGDGIARRNDWPVAKRREGSVKEAAQEAASRLFLSLQK